MNRRRFIQTAGITCLGIGPLPGILTQCVGVTYVTGTFNGKNLIIKKSDFAIIRNSKTHYRPFVVVKYESLAFPISIYRLEEDNYYALYMECTHQGCEINPYATQLVCPCHGSEYANTGKVFQGPAEKDLLQFPITTDEESIYIQIV